MFFFCLFSFCVTKTNRRNGESPYNPTRFSVILRSFCTSHYSKQENQENEREKKHNQPKTVQFCPYEMHNANRNRQPTVVFLWFVYVISVHTREHKKRAHNKRASTNGPNRTNNKTEYTKQIQMILLWAVYCVFVWFGVRCARTRARMKHVRNCVFSCRIEFKSLVEMMCPTTLGCVVKPGGWASGGSGSSYLSTQRLRPFLISSPGKKTNFWCRTKSVRTHNNDPHTQKNTKDDRTRGKQVHELNKTKQQRHRSLCVLHKKKEKHWNKDTRSTN